MRLVKLERQAGRRHALLHSKARSPGVHGTGSNPGDLEGALALLGAAEALSPSEPHFPVWRALVLLQAKRCAEAGAVLRGLKSEPPESAWVEAVRAAVEVCEPDQQEVIQ